MVYLHKFGLQAYKITNRVDVTSKYIAGNPELDQDLENALF